jgi:hypothetical protein
MPKPHLNPSFVAACLLFTGCNQKQGQDSEPSITVQLPPPRPYVPHVPAPGFSDEAIEPSFEEPPTPLASPSEKDLSQNLL